MVHIILDQESNKGLMNITGDTNEVRNDFANFFEKLYESAPDMFLQFVDVFQIYLNHLEEELKKK